MDDKQKIKHLEAELSRLKEGIPQLLAEAVRQIDNIRINYPLLEAEGHEVQMLLFQALDKISPLSAPSPEISNLPSVPQLRWVKASERMPPPIKHRGWLHIKYKGVPDLLRYYGEGWYWYDNGDQFHPANIVLKDSWSAIEWLEELPSTEEGEVK